MKNLFKKAKTTISEAYIETKVMIRSVPALLIALFVLSVVLMNLLANKVLFRIDDFLAADAGVLLSWLPFLCMDILTKRYGPKVSILVNTIAILINLFCVGIFAIAVAIPGDMNDYSAFNSVFGASWFILLGSMTAMFVAGIVNSILNFTVGKLFKKNPDGKLAYVSRTYVSTFIGQFVDNMIFAIMVYMIFGPIYWEGFEPFSFLICLGSGLFGAVIELIMEIIFSPIGYRVCKNWEKENVGQAYFNYLEQKNK